MWMRLIQKVGTDGKADWQAPCAYSQYDIFIRATEAPESKCFGKDLTGYEVILQTNALRQLAKMARRAKWSQNDTNLRLYWRPNKCIKLTTKFHVLKLFTDSYSLGTNLKPKHPTFLNARNLTKEQPRKSNSNKMRNLSVVWWLANSQALRSSRLATARCERCSSKPVLFLSSFQWMPSRWRHVSDSVTYHSNWCIYEICHSLLPGMLSMQKLDGGAVVDIAITVCTIKTPPTIPQWCSPQSIPLLTKHISEGHWSA